nr:MAG TPA_asm: hypothetical protein [Caudoviricetes sp.]
MTSFDGKSLILIIFIDHSMHNLTVLSIDCVLLDF